MKMKRMRRIFGREGRARGYTLIEVAAVLAVTATLAAVVLPVALDKTKDSKTLAAKNDILAIADGITSFIKDCGVVPAVSGNNDYNYFKILRSGTNSSAGIVGSDTTDPSVGSTAWATASIAGNVGLLTNQLVVNPNLTKLTTWKGPYVDTVSKQDPWGKNYLVYVKAMYEAGTGASKQYGWIISAGPDGVLDTNIANATVAGDDVGVMLYSNQD